MGRQAIKKLVKRTPLLGYLAMKTMSRLRAAKRFAAEMRLTARGGAGTQKYEFSRLDTGCCCVDGGEREFRQIQNLLNFTKTSNSIYAAHQFPAAYHTIDINGRKVVGQRDPARRLALVPFDFRGKTVLDLGCNQGGMVLQLTGELKWAVGIDYDPRMINAANRVKSAIKSVNTSFYVLDLQRGPLSLIDDFLPEERVDFCFLLSVCAWLKNWREVIDFAQSRSESMLFETNGFPAQQQKQIDYLRRRYRSVNLLAETSEDDPTEKERRLYHLTEPIFVNFASE
jgi:SAM-dependent methyltransferase